MALTTTTAAKADYRLLEPLILKWEGGFVNDPADAGGATNKGITLNTFKAYRKKKGRPVPTVDDLKKISQEEWREIFKTMYWDMWRADEINSQAVANILVDWYWLSGKYGITIPQKVLKVTTDGNVGAKTIVAVNSANPVKLVKDIYDARVKYIDDICKNRPANEKFRKGWMNRLADFKP